MKKGEHSIYPKKTNEEIFSVREIDLLDKNYSPVPRIRKKKKKEGRGDDGINLGLIDRSRARLRASALSADTSSRGRNV